jgi:SAM-dependent methyltransferase
MLRTHFAYPNRRVTTSFAREEVIQTLVAQNIRASRILELGCSTGATGGELKEALGATYYAGIESDSEAAQRARAQLDQVYCADVEKTALADMGLQPGSFDLLLALDVLEHLYDPWDVLAGLVQMLQPQGHVAVSVPNVQNVSVLTNLARGRWTYENAGLLDATHLRFFALEGIEQLLIGAGLTLVHTTVVLNPALDLNQVRETGNVFQDGNLTLSNLSREDMIRLFAYQYVVIARREH